MTAAQKTALRYLIDTGRWPPKARLSTWKALIDAAYIAGPRFACYATQAGREAAS
jgi:hypothetical protein